MTDTRGTARQMEYGGTSQGKEREGIPIVLAGDRPVTAERVNTAPLHANIEPLARQHVGNPGQTEFANNANDLFRRLTMMLIAVEQRQDREVIDISKPRAKLKDNLKILEKLLKLNSLEYDREPNVAKVKRWIETMGKIYETIGESEKQMVISATFKLQEAAFLALVQGNMTVAQYEARYSTLARYNSHLIPSEVAKTRRFVRGLRDEYRIQLVALRFTKYFEAVEFSHDIEYSMGHDMLKREQIHRQTGNKRQEQLSGNHGRFSNNKGKQVIQKGTSRQQRMWSSTTFEDSCGFCGKETHKEAECWKKLGKCFGCGATDHLVAECSKGEPKTVAARVQRAKQATTGMKRTREGKPKTRDRVLGRTRHVYGGIFNISCT